MSEGIPNFPHGELQKREPNIRSSRQLAELLGFVRNPTEKPTSNFRTFEKPLTNFSLTVGDDTHELTGYQVLEFDDVGKFDTERTERIYAGIRIGDDPFTRWRRNVSVEKYAASEDTSDNDISLPKTHNGEFNKQSMRSGGYNSLYKLLQSMQDIGHFKDSLLHLQQNMTENVNLYYGRVNTVLVPKLREIFPEYDNMQVNYPELAEAFINTSEIESNKKFRTLQINLMQNRIYVAFKKGRDFYCVHPPFETMPDDQVWASWHFNSEDSENMDKTITAALNALRKKMLERS